MTVFYSNFNYELFCITLFDFLRNYKYVIVAFGFMSNTSNRPLEKVLYVYATSDYSMLSFGFKVFI